MPQGTTTINFGAFPGALDASVTITGGATGTLGEAWIVPVATADHSVDEHILAAPTIRAAAPSGGNLTIYGVAQSGEGAGARNASAPRCYGLWTVGWVTN